MSIIDEQIESSECSTCWVKNYILQQKIYMSFATNRRLTAV